MGRVFRTGKSEFKSKRQRSRVLIVEDHPMMRIGIRSLLDHSEHFTVCAECPNSRTALAQLRGDQPDMVILDITLPGGLDGMGDLTGMCANIQLSGGVRMTLRKTPCNCVAK